MSIKMVKIKNPQELIIVQCPGRDKCRQWYLKKSQENLILRVLKCGWTTVNGRIQENRRELGKIKRPWERYKRPVQKIGIAKEWEMSLHRYSTSFHFLPWRRYYPSHSRKKNTEALKISNLRGIRSLESDSGLYDFKNQALSTISPCSTKQTGKDRENKIQGHNKAKKTGTCLVAQWLRIRLPMQGTRVWALVREDPTCRGATKPVCHNYWACVLQLLKPVCLKPVLCNKRSHHNDKPAHHNEE